MKTEMKFWNEKGILLAQTDVEAKRYYPTEQTSVLCIHHA
jgi:hypothetical protein